ncbi:hypothetical protein QA597_08390 [Marinilabiliaceae bacterium ANBcel2]|nr:hypothetical protein [Marinilabiliaceae bacterium ANBcel2]
MDRREKKIKMFFYMLIKPFYLLLSFFLLFSVNLYSNGFADAWEDLNSLEDADKNFRFDEVTDLLVEELSGLSFDEIGDLLPSSWGSSRSGDSLFVTAGLLRYSQSNNPHRLIVIMAFNQGDPVLYRTEVVRSRRIDRNDTLAVDVNVGYGNDKGDGDLPIPLNVGYDGISLLEMPDIYIHKYLYRIVYSRDQNYRNLYNDKLQKRVVGLYKTVKNYDSAFECYNFISTLTSDNGRLGITTWNIERRDGRNNFYGVIGKIVDDERFVTQLTDSHRSIEDAQRASLDHSNWYGAVYYDIVEKEIEGEMVYTLLGYNAYDSFVKVRLTDVLTFSQDRKPLFNTPLFSMPDGYYSRLIYKYSQRANMMLRYDKERNRIVMDNLSPQESYFEGDRRYYGPDFSHNALIFENNRWVYYDEVDLRNR